jgi:trehalose 6-phosphate phosphatase
MRTCIAARAADLGTAGITVEDKGLSLALHYRLAPDRARAIALIRDLISDVGPALRTFPGKLVENIVPADAADKAQAVHALVARCGADNAFFAGDDVNDEPVFEAAGTDWLTVRVGRDNPRSRARFFLDSQEEMPLVLEEMINKLAP